MINAVNPMLSEIRILAREIRPRAAEIEAVRRMSPDMADKLKEIDRYRMDVPESYGSFKLDFPAGSSRAAGTVRWLKMVTLACTTALGMISFFFCPSALGATVAVSETKIIVDHVTVSSDKPYVLVKEDFERRLGRVDDNIRTLLKEKKVDELRAALQKAAGKDGLEILYVGVHGDWLILKGQQKNGIEYFTGNILTAIEMTSVNMAAGLYAPLRIMVYENAQSGTTIEYDKPSTQLSQFHSAAIDVQGRSLDERLAKLCASALQ